MLIALLAAALTAAALSLVQLRQLVRERDAALRAAREALERLVQARKDGYEIPDPATDQAVPVEEPLIPELEELISDWETEGAQQQQRRVIRVELAKGKTQMQVVRELMPRVAGEEEIDLGSAL